MIGTENKWIYELWDELAELFSDSTFWAAAWIWKAAGRWFRQQHRRAKILNLKRTTERGILLSILAFILRGMTFAPFLQGSFCMELIWVWEQHAIHLSVQGTLAGMGSREDDSTRSASTFPLELRKKLGNSQAAQTVTKTPNLSF